MLVVFLVARPPGNALNQQVLSIGKLLTVSRQVLKQLYAKHRYYPPLLFFVAIGVFVGIYNHKLQPHGWCELFL